MKKLIIMVVAVAMLLSLVAFAYGAQDVASKRQLGYNNRENSQFIDEDGDGICDKAGLRARDGSGEQFIDEDGDGICDKAGLGNGEGRRHGRQNK